MQQQEDDPKKAKWKLVEEDGYVHRGPSPHRPQEFWDWEKQQWVPFRGQTPKPEGWGHEITPEDFEELKQFHAANPRPPASPDDDEETAEEEGGEQPPTQ